MWWIMDGKRDNACDPVEWINANFKIRESSLLDFLYDEGFQHDRFKAVIRRTRGNKGQTLPLDGNGVPIFNVGVQPGYYMGAGSLDGNSGWFSSAPSPNSHRFFDSTLNSENDARSINRNEAAETMSVGIRQGLPLPFEDNRFDMVTIASSVEQISNFKTILQEAYRILRRGGRLRLNFDAPENCDDSHVHRLWICSNRIAEKPARLVFCGWSRKEESIRHFGFFTDLSMTELTHLIGQPKLEQMRASFPIEALAKLKGRIQDATGWKTECPCCKSLLKMLKEIGFRSVKPSSLAEDVLERLSRRSDGSLLEAAGRTERCEESIVEEAVLTVDIPAGFPRIDLCQSIKGQK